MKRMKLNEYIYVDRQQEKIAGVMYATGYDAREMHKMEYKLITFI